MNLMLLLVKLKMLILLWNKFFIKKGLLQINPIAIAHLFFIKQFLAYQVHS